MKGTVIRSVAILSLVVLLPGVAIAQSLSSPAQNFLEEPDSPCYVRQSDGTVIDLSSWCVKNPPAVLSPSASFVSNFRSLAKNYPPNIRQELNQYSEKHRDSAIASAKTTCRVLRYGGSQAELTRSRALAAYHSSPSEVAKQQITYALAINQYCPEFANR
ncbi:DUF732 domain-containing protein [Allocoleopsis franciscana]|uniref:DUF732 domain-containing protein n=1 Tax=Allocoleopsis franciscana PCC 7113 TaxID=1173027 RepID=K9WG41_9CYAN|nr:DUF732 domain-containing protein [Allocoleopsis franciscana]AFZ18766.1 hypothetical protein Mic7113_2993 [Allocoleopsis franciscana PCC 7113]